MFRDNLEDIMPLMLKILGAILLVVLIAGSIYTFSRVNTTLADVEKNADAQVKAAIAQIGTPAMTAPEQTTKTTSQLESPKTIVAKAQEAFQNNDVIEGRRQLLLLNDALILQNGTETARQLNRDLITAIDKGNIAIAQSLSDQLLAELNRINQT